MFSILIFARLILAYVYAAMFSASVSMTITATAWTSIWTYLALLGGLALSWLTLAAIFAVPFIILAVAQR